MERVLHWDGLRADREDELRRDAGVLTYQVVMSRYQGELSRSNAIKGGVVVRKEMGRQRV